MKKNKAYIAIYRRNTRIKRFQMLVGDDGKWCKAIVKKDPKTVREFRGWPGKPATRMAMEAVMLAYKGYDPAKHRVTIEPRGE